MMKLPLLLAALLLTACATQTSYSPAGAPASVAAAAVKVGDFWEYAVKDFYTGFDRGLWRYQVSHA